MDKNTGIKIIAQNKKAYHDFFVLEKLEKNLSEIQNEETADNRYFIIYQ